MGKVVSSAMMSLDGYIAKADNTIGRLFDWLNNGDVDVPTATPDMTFHMTPGQRRVLARRGWTRSARSSCGRTLFDFTDGWGGQHTMGAPVVVVTHEVPTDWVDAHPDAPLTFVTDGVGPPSRRRRSIAGDRMVAVAAGTIARQSLELGLLDEVAVDLVPVVMGRASPTSADGHHRRHARRPDDRHPGRPGHPPGVPGQR